MIIVLTIIILLKMFFNICDVLFPHFCLLKKKPLTEKRTHFSQGIIKISLLILFTVSHTVLVMMVWKI